MTLREMAQKALDVQDACNLSGVAATFAEVTSAMRGKHNMDTPTCNRHPISVLFIDKMASLAMPDTTHAHSDAYAQVKAMAAEYDPPQEVIDAVEELLDIGVVKLHDRQSGETFTECKVCGKIDEHEVTCPVPMLEQWMKL